MSEQANESSEKLFKVCEQYNKIIPYLFDLDTFYKNVNLFNAEQGWCNTLKFILEDNHLSTLSFFRKHSDFGMREAKIQHYMDTLIKMMNIIDTEILKRPQGQNYEDNLFNFLLANVFKLTRN